jgi:hypothetical protein
MALVNDPKTFTLVNQGDKVKTLEYLSLSQGVYLNFLLELSKMEMNLR